MAFDPTLRADVQAFSSKQGVAETFAEATRQEGLFDGQKVTVLDVNSQVADAAEEVGSMVSEKVEKKLSERKAGSKEALRASATELAERYVNLITDGQGGRKLHEFLDALKQRGKNVTEEQLRQLAGEHFKDPSEQYAALSFAEEALTAEGGHDLLLATVRAAKAQLMKDAGAAIRSGLNIASDVVAFARTGLESTEALRDLYRYALLGGQSIGSIYSALMTRYGSEQFAQSLDFLLRAAASDLDGKTLGSSIEPTQLKASIDDIYHVQSLGNLHRALGEVLATTRRLFAT